MKNRTAGRPIGFVLGALLLFTVMQLLRWLQLPDTLLGIAAKTCIQAVAIFATATIAVTRLRAARFVALALPVIFVGNLVWPSFYGGLPSEDKTFTQLVMALLIGAGLGALFVMWTSTHRRESEQSK